MLIDAVVEINGIDKIYSHTVLIKHPIFYLINQYGSLDPI